MSIFDLFAEKHARDFEKLPAEQRALCERIFRFINDDEAQNAALPDIVQELLKAGGAVDEVPDAKGEFGRTPKSQSKSITQICRRRSGTSGSRRLSNSGAAWSIF
jgi:hypothetical protein